MVRVAVCFVAWVLLAGAFAIPVGGYNAVEGTPRLVISVTSLLAAIAATRIAFGLLRSPDRRARGPIPESGANLAESASSDADLAARAIDYAARLGGARHIRGRRVADAYYDALAHRPDEWDDLCTSLILAARAERWAEIMGRFGEVGLTSTVAEYRARFVPAFESRLRQLGRGYDGVGPLPKREDPAGPIAPWLQLLAEIERSARPSLLERILG